MILRIESPSVDSPLTATHFPATEGRHSKDIIAVRFQMRWWDVEWSPASRKNKLPRRFPNDLKDNRMCG